MSDKENYSLADVLVKINGRDIPASAALTLEELVTEIYNNYYALHIKGLGDVSRIEIKFKECSKLEEIIVNRVGDLTAITELHRNDCVFNVALTKSNYEVILNAVIMKLSIKEGENE